MKQVILIVDSEKSWLNFSKTILEKNGYIVLTAVDVQSAQRLLELEPNNKINLILIDIKSIEENDDISKFRNWSTDDAKRSIVVLFPIGLTTVKARIAFKAGASDCVDKPYDEDALLALIEQILAEHRLANTLSVERIPSSSNIIVVEDDYDWMQSILRYLPSGSVIEEVTDYQIAVEKILLKHYDLAIFDLRLVDVDDDNFQGMNLVKLTREKDAARESFTQIIVLSAFGTPEQIREIYRSYNVYYYFDKRLFFPDIFKDAVTKSLGEYSYMREDWQKD